MQSNYRTILLINLNPGAGLLGIAVNPGGVAL